MSHRLYYYHQLYFLSCKTFVPVRPPQSIITSSFCLLSFLCSYHTSPWNMEPIVWIMECIWAYQQCVSSSHVMEISLRELKTPAPTWTCWSLLTSQLSSWHLSLAPCWTLLSFSIGSLLPGCWTFLSLPPLFSYWLSNIPLETYFQKSLKPLMSVNFFICPNNGLLFGVGIKFCAEKPYSLELWKFIPLLLAASVALEKYDVILIVSPFHITYFSFAFWKHLVSSLCPE